VNRTLLALAVVAAAGLPAFGQAPPAYPPAAASRPAAAASSGRSKVAIMNINKVIKNYNRANQLGQNVANNAKVYAEQLNALRAKATAEQNKMQNAKTEQERAASEKVLTNLQREAQDKNAEAEKEIRKQQAQVLVQIYKDVESVVAALAASNDLDMVLSYPDAPSETEASSEATIIRKMQAPALMPIFYNRNALDITDAVVQTLNKSFPAPPPTAQPGGAAPGGTTPPSN
jgi:Skp family chaperone for outer membrane proteins